MNCFVGCGVGFPRMRSRGEERPCRNNLRRGAVENPHHVEIRILPERPFLYFIAFEFLRVENWQ